MGTWIGETHAGVHRARGRNGRTVEMVLLLIIVIFLALVLVYLGWQYNRLVTWRNRVRNGLAQIDVQLARRSGLIGNLVETVKGYVTHERATLENVVAKRYEGAMSAARAGEEARAQEEAIPKLLAIAEAYPDLKAAEAFLNLQEELVNTESRVAYARQFYNDAVNRYNTLQETFPTVLVAKLGAFSLQEYFLAADDDRHAVAVKL